MLLIYIYLFLLGAVFGSFGSVLLWRLQGEITKETIFGIVLGRSKCPHCQIVLQPRDLVPFFSWLLQRGKCRYCQQFISIFYPLLELFSGISFVFSFYLIQHLMPSLIIGSNGFWLNLIFLIVINWILVLFVMSDFLFYELNINFRIFLTLWIILWQSLGIVGNFQLAFYGGVSFFLIYLLIYYFGKFYVKIRFGLDNTEGFGGGDVMVAFSLGLLSAFFFTNSPFVWIDLIEIIFILILISSLLGLILYLFSLLIFKGKYGRAIPFLPALILAYWIIVLYGNYFLIFIK